MTNTTTDLAHEVEAIGGRAGLRDIVADFYERILDDAMIGYMFRDADPERLIEKETELVAKLLGVPGAEYTGRPMRRAHARHRIFGGQYERRQQILRETLAAHDAPDALAAAWLEHNDRLRPLVTADPGSDCGVGMQPMTADDERPDSERHVWVSFPED